MVSLDPDDFLADVSDNSFPAGPEQEDEEEEELEWLSNKDSFPEVETCMLTATPRSPPADRPVQARKTLPTYPTKKAAERIVCKYCGITQTLQSPQGVCNICGFVYKSCPNVGASEKKCTDKAETRCASKDGDRRKSVDRKCTHCGISKSPLWREGPLGRKTLCNACGVRYKSGRLCAEYRPLNSPTYCKEFHSNAHRKVLELRKQNCGLVEKPVNACIKNAATTFSKNSKNHLLPAVPTVSVSEQPSRSIITEQHSPVLVLENITNSTTTHMSFCETLKQKLFCNESNDKHIREDTAKLEIERDSTIVVRSCGTHKRPHKAPNEVLVQHCVCSYQPNSKRKNEDTAAQEIEAKRTNLISSCGFLEPFHQAPYNYLDQQQLYPNRPNTKRRKKETAKVDMVVEPVDKCTNSTTTLMTLKKVPFPVVETLNILEQPSVIAISEQQNPVSLRENRTSSSTTFLSSSGTFGSTHQTPCKILGQQQQSYDQANNKLIEQDTAKLENEGNGTTFLNSSWALEPSHHFQEKLPELFGKLANNKPDKKKTARVESSMLTITVAAHPPPNIAISQLNQCHPVSAVQDQTLPPLPSFPTKKSKRVVCKYCGITQTLPSPQGVCNICGFKYNSGPSVNASERKSSDKAETPCLSDDGDRWKNIDRKCAHCGITRSPQWREGPLGLKTLCNACGVRYRSGRLSAEYRPLNSPTYSKELHSNSHRKVLELRKQKYGMVEKPMNEGKRNAATTASKRSKKDLLPVCPAVNIFEQPIRSIITKQRSPVSVLKNSRNSTTTQVSFCETLKQQLFCDQPNEKHIQQDTAKLENDMDSTSVMSSCEALRRPHKAPNEVLVQHPRCSYQPNSQSKNKDTALVEIEVNSTTLISSCGIRELFHQAPYNYLEQQQLNQADNNQRKKDTAKVEMVVKSVNKCTNSSSTLMTSKKDLFPAVETSNILEQPSVIVMSEQQIPVSVLENRTSSSTTLLSSSGTVDPLHQTPCDIVGQQSYDQGNNKLIEQDTAKVETEGNSTTFRNSSWGLEPSHHLPEKLQELFCMKANNKPDKKETARVESEGNFSTLMISCGTLKPPNQVHKCLGQDQLFYKQAQETNKENGAIVEIRGKCQICGDKQSPHWLGGPLGSETLCHACGLANCKAKQQRGTAVEIENQCCPSPATGEFTTSTYTVPVFQDLFLSMNLSDIDIADYQKPFLALENSPNDSTLMSFCRIKIPHRSRTKGLRKRRRAIPEQQMGIERKCLLCGKQTHRWQMGPFGAKTLCNAYGNRYQPLCGKSSVTVDIVNECQHCESEETLQLLASPFGPKSLCNACYHWFKYGRWLSCNSSKSDPDKKASAETERMPGMWW